MRKYTSLLLCGVAIAALNASMVDASSTNSGRGATKNEIQVSTASSLSGNTESMVGLFNTAMTDAELQMIVGSAAKDTSTRNGLFKVAKTNPKVAAALMNRMEGDVTYRDQIILDLVMDVELVQMLINTYASTHPKATATLAAASSVPATR